MDAQRLEELGIRFGQGLQLVNILRDESEDLAQGRGYLPSSRAGWLEKARENLAAGLTYAAAMRLKRLHIAVALPARIGLETLDAMEAATGMERVKISRRRVWHHLAASWMASWSGK
jgi:farnesyl-diphosphate farnesyltransferase